MRPPKYPLEPLARLREKRVEEAVGALATATRARDSAECQRLDSEQKRHAHAAASDRVRAAEAAALARGELNVSHLAHGDAWEARIAAERDEITLEADRARAGEVCARAGEERALDEVASRKADARVVEKDRVRWDGAQRRRAEALDEEASSEAWRPPRP